MDLAVGNIVTGKVTTITKFGAFIALPEGKSGLVHISEVAPTFLSVMCMIFWRRARRSP